MGIFKRILRLGKQQVEKGLDKLEDDIKILETNLQEYLESQRKVKISLDKLKGTQKKYEADLSEIENILFKLDKVAEKALLLNEEKSAKEAFNLRKLRENEKNILIKNIETNKIAIENVEKKLTLIDKKIKEFNYKIQELKTKKEFSNSIGEINKIVNEVNDATSNLSESKDIINKIETDYYIAEVQIENMDKEDNIETLMDEYDYDFEAYKNEILNRNKEGE